MLENNFLVSTDTVKGLRKFSDDINKMGNYKGQKRSISNGANTFSLIFKDNNELEYSENGIGSMGRWNLEASNTLILEIGGKRLWYKPLYITKALLILYSEIDKKNYCFVSENYDIKSIEQYYKKLNQGAINTKKVVNNNKIIFYWFFAINLILAFLMSIYDLLK